MISDVFERHESITILILLSQVTTVIHMINSDKLQSPKFTKELEFSDVQNRIKKNTYLAS